MAESIVCVSTMMWDGLPTRKQRFMAHLAAHGYEVVYVEPPLSVFAPFRQPELATGLGLRGRVREAGDRLWVFTPGLSLPGAGGRAPSLQSLRYRWYYRGIRSVLRRLGLRPTVQWVYTAEAYPFLHTLGERVTVFDCVDDLAHYPGIDPVRTAELQDRLVRDADVVITSARGLCHRWQQINPRTAFIPNGYDDGLYRPSRPGDTPAPRPSFTEELAERPLAVFVGGIYEWIDLDLLEQSARSLPGVGFVLAGPVGAGVNTAGLAALDNVVLPGRLAVDDAAALVRSAAVCLCPFRSGPLTDSVNPLKVYEYLGAGKPCVTTPMRELVPLCDVLYVADSAVEFAGCIEQAVAEDDAGLPDKRVRAVGSYRWSELCAQAESVLREAL